MIHRIQDQYCTTDMGAFGSSSSDQGPVEIQFQRRWLEPHDPRLWGWVHARTRTWARAASGISCACIIVVVEGDESTLLAFASSSAYRERACYAGIAEFSVYVARRHRGKGAGRVAMSALIDAATKVGFWKLVSRIFPENRASLALMVRMGFHQVGTYHCHGMLDGQWRDCIIVERLFGEVALQNVSVPGQ